MKQLIITISVFSLLLTSCNQKEIDWNFDNEPSNLLVVEAILTNEKIKHSVKLSKPYQEQNQVPITVSGAEVVIVTNDSIPEVYNAIETPIGSGIYLTDSMRAVSGKEYTLTISYDGNIYSATETQPFVEPMDTLRVKTVSDSLFTIDFNDFGSEPNYVIHVLNWQSSKDCSIPSECKALQIYYDLKNFDVNKQFAPDQEQVNFPSGTSIIRKKHSVSEPYKEYLRGVLSETAWRGGLFDAYPANAPTNLSEGAIGFFAISTVLSDTTIIK